MVLVEVAKRGRAKRQKGRGGFAVPTPYKFDFTWAEVSGFENGKQQVQSVTNFLNPVKSRPGKPSPYKSGEAT